jgi:basic membrane lipoprotein Med (substrate-binding protein (PBP1-ABC) superfamily)
VAAVVSVHESLDGELQQAAADGIPIVMVDVPDIDPEPSLSTVGNARHDQAGFLAGVMTGLASQTGWVGQVTATSGPDEQAYSAGFTQGLLWGCPKCQLISQTASDMTMDRFRANSVDVVFIFPGPGAADAAALLASGSIPVVWVGDNAPAAAMLVGNITVEEGFAVVIALEDLIETGEGRFWQPSIQTYSVVPVDINPKFISPGRQRLLEEAFYEIVAGDLDIGTAPDD